MRFSITTRLVVLLFCYAALGAPRSAAQSQTFHVQGTVTDFNEGVIPEAKVSFHSDQMTKAVTTNAEGVYEADLDLGVYSMTVQSPHFHLFHRPAFRVTSPMRITFNATLLVAGSCDVTVSNSSGTPPTQDELDGAVRLFCAREESFPVPSADGVPFELYVHYGNRTAVNGSYAYTSQKLLAPQVFVAYNLFSLLADNVVYDAAHRTLEASGHVVVIRETAAAERADSISLKVENGEAIPLR
jgi:hypothetical protein